MAKHKRRDDPTQKSGLHEVEVRTRSSSFNKFYWFSSTALEKRQWELLLHIFCNLEEEESHRNIKQSKASYSVVKSLSIRARWEKGSRKVFKPSNENCIWCACWRSVSSCPNPWAARLKICKNVRFWNSSLSKINSFTSSVKQFSSQSGSSGNKILREAICSSSSSLSRLHSTSSQYS